MRKPEGIRPPRINICLLTIPGYEQIGMNEALHLLAEHGVAVQEWHLAAYNKVTNDICELSVFQKKSQPDLLIDIFITKLTAKALLILNNLPPIDVLFQDAADLYFECLQNNNKIKVVNFQKRLKKAELKVLKKDKKNSAKQFLTS